MNPQMARELLRARQQDWSRSYAAPHAASKRDRGAEPAPRARRRHGAFSTLLAAARLAPRGR